MKDNGYQSWFRNHHGEIVEPAVVLRVLSEYHRFPIQTFVRLENSGHLIPMSYNKGRVTSVRLFFPQRPASLSEIEHAYELPRKFLAGRLNSLFEEGGSAERNFLDLNDEVLDELVKQRYIKVNKNFIRLGRSG